MTHQLRAVVLLLLLGLAFSSQANEFKSRRQLQTGGQSMRIWVDYADSDNQWKDNALKDKYFFSKKIMERTKIYYSSVLNVKNRKDSYTWPDIKMTDTKTVSGRTVNYDLWTYFYVYNKDNTNFAAASPHHYDDTTGRPIVGYFELNLNAISGTKNLDAIQYMNTFVHEFYHILVFNSELFDKFRDDSNKVIGKDNLVGSVTLGGKSRQTYKGTNVLSWAKTYLNYNSLTYLVLENDGGGGSAGSHWEHRYWSTEYMSPIDTRPGILSALSLRMALDSGWFTLNEKYIEELEYGKSAGADIQTDSCPTSSLRGFCTTTNEISCGPDWGYKARCYTDSTYSEGCNFKWADVFCSVPDGEYGSNLDATYDNLGDTSRCVITTPQGGSAKPICAKTTCTGTTAVKYTFKNGKTCDCNGGAASCTDATVTVTCPSSSEISDLCTRLQDANRCPGDCSGKGLCLGPNGSKNCFCIYGWTGNDCNTASTTETDGAVTTTAVDSTSKKISGILGWTFMIVAMSLGLLN